MHYSHSSREPTGNITTAPPNRNQEPRATGARTGSRLWACGVEGKCRTGARSKADSESALRRRRGRSRNFPGHSHGVGRQGCRPHWHTWWCASAVVLARCPLTSWLGSRCLRRQRAAVESHGIPAVPSAEIGVFSLGFALGELVSFFAFDLIRSVTDILRHGAEKVTRGSSLKPQASSFREAISSELQVRNRKGRNIVSRSLAILASARRVRSLTDAPLA